MTHGGRRPLHLAVDGHGLTRPQAGIGTYTREILGEMAAARPRNRITLHVPSGSGVAAPVPSIALREIPGTRLLGRHALWPRRVRRQAPDAYFGPAGQMPLGSLGCPAVVTIHDLAIYREPAWFPGGQFLSTRFVVPRSIRRAARIVAVSESTAADLREIFSVEADRITVVHHGVAGRFRPLPVDGLEAVRRRFGLPARFILFVGTIEPRKNLATLLEAWAMLPDRPPLVIAGGWGWGYEAVRERMSRMGPGLIHIGGVDPVDLPALYNLAACLAHPAWYEGFGLTPLESMACGTPAISSGTSSLPEVVGDAGVLVDPGDAGAWAAALARVLGDPGLSADLRRRGILRAAEFTWARAAEATWRAIEAVSP